MLAHVLNETDAEIELDAQEIYWGKDGEREQEPDRPYACDRMVERKEL